MKKIFSVTFIIFCVVSCGGGGGGGGAPAAPVTPAASVNLSADPTSVLLTNTSTLTWSTSNATSCSASGAWSGTKDTSGSEAVTISTAGNNSFTLSCTGAGGTGSASVTVEGYRNTDGVVVDGYISGAEVFIDEDDDWIADSNESSTTSDNDGKFTIKYANGNLVSIGGTDLDSQTLLDNLLITHKLTGHSDFKAVTPVTSVAAFMTDAANVNAALGIDSTIDIAIFDPVANKGDGGINDFLYEKGNQLTVLAYALQNITNNLNTTTDTTQDYFKAITEELEKEYTETTTKVDIETEVFITKALDNIVAAKTVTITDEAKANTTKALSGVMPVIEVKSSNDLTTAVIRFAVSTLQTDIQAIANGTASAETVSSYSSDVLTYIAEDQNIEADEITPDINAIADTASTNQDTSITINVLLNDSYLNSASIGVTARNGSNGTTSVANNIITYTPDVEFNGTDTFGYTITQGDKTSSADVTVTVISSESNTILGDILPSSDEIDLSESEANLIVEVEFEDSIGINLENLPNAEIVYESSVIDTSGIQLSGSNSSNYSKYKYLKLTQWKLQSGNSNKGTFRANGTIPQYLRGGFYNINSGYFYDNNGYRKNKTQNKAIKLIVEGDAPELSNLTISSNEVDVSSEAKTITLTVNAKDVSGINLDNLPLARIDAKGGSGSINANSKWTLKSGTEYDGIYETSITISKDAVAGDYLVATGNFYDVHGNLYYLLSLYGSNSGGITISTSVEGDAPELSNLTISSNEVDVSSEAKTITLTVNAKDVSGINLDNLPLARIDAKGGSGSINANSKWTLKSGTEYDGIYETSITISKDAVAGDYLVATGNFYDVHGSYFYILTGYGTNDNGINITSTKEGVIPSVSEFTVNPNKVYVLSDSATINLTIKASDDSGIDDSRLAKPSIYQQNSALSISSDKAWERTDGDIYNGTYSASIEIPKGSIPGSYSINSGYFYDINNNFNYENSLYGSASGGLDIFNEDAPEVTIFSGEAIDGYISGANVFIDENFNFNKDVGEFSATTDTNGQFQIQVASNTKAACLRNRPIIANVPIGAIDSTYGNVTEAYQMLLPSINDAGIDKIVISPFTTLLSEAIIQGKIASNLDQDLTLEEGCGTKGNNVQTQVSSKITTLINDLENTYGFTYKQLIADFIEGDTPYGESHLFYENNARNLAGYYPTIKNIQDIISDDFSSNLGIEVTANLSLSKNAIDSIFSGDDEIANSNKLPLEFTATYLTSKDSNNWYQDEFMKANGAKIDANDNVYRHDYCPSGFATSDCVKNLSLQAIKDMSSTYEQRSEWRNDNIPANAIPGINAGTIEFSVIDKRNFDATEGQLKCNLDEILKFDEVDGDFENEYQYRPQIGIDDNSAGTYAGFKLKKCGFTNSSKSVAINVERVKADTNEIVGTSYRTNSKARSRIISTSTPHNLIDNKGSFDPLDVIREISQIPWKLSDVEKMRSLLGYNENVNIFFKESNEIGGTRRSISLTALPWKDNYTDDNNVEFLGIDARTKFFEAINAWNPAAKLNLDSTYLGGSSFPESKALFRLSSQGAYTFQVGNPDERIWIVPEIEFSGNTTYMLGNFYGQNIDLETLQDIAKNGIGTKTVSVNGSLEINGDISGTLPIKLYLYEGSDDILNAGEGYFSIETNISFSPTNDPQGRTDNNLRDGIRRAMRLTLAAGEEIKFTFNDSNGTKIEKTIINNDIDTNIIEDESGSINIPTSLVDKVLVALNAIGLDYSNAIAEFFKEQGQYTYKITFGDYFIMPWDFTYSNAIKGTFTVASDPSVAVYWSGGLLYIGENTSQNLCFHTNKSNPEDITISLAPIFGSGPGYADSSDFTISKTSITIPATTGSSQQQCTTITALRDDVLGESYDKFDIKYDVTGAVRATNELIEVILRDF